MTECDNCGYEWSYSGQLEKTTCPSCQSKTTTDGEHKRNHDLQITQNEQVVAVTVTTITGEGQLAENIADTIQEEYDNE